MKKYLFGLGAMVVGAGLMFVLMHGEVEAFFAPDGMTKVKCELFDSDITFDPLHQHNQRYTYCKINDLTCVTHVRGIGSIPFLVETEQSLTPL